MGERKENGTKPYCGKCSPEGGGVPKIVRVQWTSKGVSMNVKADGFLSRNPIRALSFCLFFPQSAMDGKESMYRGHSVNMCRLVCKACSSQWGHAVGSSGKNLVRYSPVGVWFVRTWAMRLK